MNANWKGAWLVFAAMLGACGGSDSVDPDEFPGLTADVEILVDDLGIPHIYGQTDADAFYGAGYAMARDRLFQMDLLRRRALGRWAEVAGDAHFADDKLSRLLDFGGLGRRDAEMLAAEHPEAWALVVAWCAGINRFVDEVAAGTVPLPYGFGPDELDYVPERWVPSDLVAVSRIAFFSTSNTLEGELLASVLRKFFPEAFEAVQLVKPFAPVFAVPPEDRPASKRTPASPASRRAAAPVSVPPDLGEQFARLMRLFEPYRLVGSNNWAVDGRFTENGRPLIANDPHLPLEVPNVMYPIHISSVGGTGTMDVAGFTLAGSLGVSLGHNAHVAWTATTGFGDVMDVWEVTITGDQATVGDAMAPIVRRTENVIVRGEGMPAGEGTTIPVDVDDVPGYGVLLPDDLIGIPITEAGRRLLLNYTGFKPFSGGEALLRLQRAASIADFEAAVDDVPGLGFNFVAADADGITYRVGEAIPDRGVPTQAPYLVMDGDDADSFWTGEHLPPEKLPHSRAEERGWLATANNDPFGFTEDGDVLNDPWYYGGLFAPGFRAARIEAELTRLVDRGELTVDDMRTLQHDAYSPLAEALVPRLEEAWSHVDTDEALAEFRDREDLATLVTMLAAWDRGMTRDSPEAVVFRAWLFHAASAALEDDVSLLYGRALELPIGVYTILKITGLAFTGGYPDADVILQEGADVLLMGALASTADWIAERWGSVDAEYSYGEVHGTLFTNGVGGALDHGWFATDGADDTVNNSPATFRDGAMVAERWDNTFGPVFRTVMSFAADGTPEATVDFAMGASGEPGSDHFDDALDGWIEGTGTIFPYARADVEAAMAERIVLPAE